MSLKDITLGRYVSSESILHGLDPRTKLLSLLIVMTGLFAGHGWQSIALAGIYAVSACKLSGLPASYLFRSLLPFKWLIIMTFLISLSPILNKGIASSSISASFSFMALQ